MTHKLCQNANFENGGTPIQDSIRHVLLNILSKASLSRVHGTFVYFELHKKVAMALLVLEKIKKMQKAC